MTASWTAAPIVVVDDDRHLRELLTRLLERRGRSVIAAASGGEALAFVRARPLLLVISDQQMPGMTGLQLLAAVRHERPGLPFILTSAAVDGDLRREAFAAGADAVVDKGDLVRELTSYERLSRLSLAS